MMRRKAGALVAFGMAFLVVGLVLRQWPGGNYWHFGSGFLLGLAVVLVIGGVLKQRRHRMQ